MTEETQVEYGVRLKFETHGDRQAAFGRAVDHFDRNFHEGWRLTYVEEELDTGYHEDLDKIPDNGNWDCRYDAVGFLKARL